MNESDSFGSSKQISSVILARLNIFRLTRLMQTEKILVICVVYVCVGEHDRNSAGATGLVIL